MLPFLDQDQLSLRSRIRDWTEKNLFGRTDQRQDVEVEARELVRQLGSAGFLTYTVPGTFDGTREKVQARDLCILREELSRGSALADTMFAIQALGSYPITLFGTEEQKKLYLPSIAKGTAIAAFALTEPDAGSDIAALQTRALRRGKEYSLTGTKSFISNAGIADSYVVFASTSPEKKNKGISAFVVDASAPGLVVKERTQVISPHPIGVIAFENCVVPENSLLGNAGDGLQIALGTLDVLRCTVGAAALGFAQRAMEEAVDHSRKRRQFDRPLTEFQGIQFKLAEMATELEAARLLVYQAAWAHDSGAADAKVKSSMAKLFATEAAQRIVDQALQIHGGMGVVVGSVVERLYRDVRALRIYEGTSEIQKIVIARELIKPRGVKGER
ncbi:MAG TPA: acyl-CoA dehydrogenase family protein [Candidatus Binatia bacterium]|nr:acyl-CoA dehydrogenase family protein [Candidatus Binatia bacterium]